MPQQPNAASSTSDSETVSLRLPSGEMVDALVPKGLSDDDVRSYARMKRPDLFGAPAGVNPPAMKMDSGEGPLASGLTSMETQLANTPKAIWQSTPLSWFTKSGQQQLAYDEQNNTVSNALSKVNPVAKTDPGTPNEQMDWGATAANLLPFLAAGKLGVNALRESAPPEALSRAATAGVNMGKDAMASTPWLRQIVKAKEYWKATEPEYPGAPLPANPYEQYTAAADKRAVLSRLKDEAQRSSRLEQPIYPGAPLPAAPDQIPAKTKIGGRYVLTPEEELQNQQIQKIAKRRASERGMQYAAGMRPSGVKLPTP